MSKYSRWNIMPVMPGERTWGLFSFVWIQSGLSIATWAFMLGGANALFVGVADGVLAMLIGNGIAVTLMALSAAMPSCKWGVEQFTILRTALGVVGALILLLALVPLMQMGWTIVLSVMFARASGNLSSQFMLEDFSNTSAVVSSLAILAMVVGWWVINLGSNVIAKLNNFVAPLLITICFILIFVIMDEYSLSEILSAEPIDPLSDHATNFMIAVELNLVAGLSWWTTVGNLARPVKTQRSAFWGIMIGLVPVAILAQLVGMISALMLGDSDPTVWMMPIAGPVLGIFILMFIAFANLTSLASLAFSACQAFSQAMPNLAGRISWGGLCALFFVIPAISVIIWPAAVYDHFFTFLAWTQALVAPVAAVMLVDYFLLRKQYIKVSKVYDTTSNSPYFFWNGVNPVAMLSLVCGVVTYLYLLNPLTLESTPPFSFVSATLPAFFIAGGLHWLGVKLFLIPKGIGDYVRNKNH